VIELRQEMGRHEENLARLEKEREKIHAEQKRIRENLQALGDRTSEKELRERFVRALNSQEDRLEQIEKEVREQTTARDRCREQINAVLADLEYEAAV
jgi:predicted  nucleic acid-binding Zn-ribbon protein